MSSGRHVFLIGLRGEPDREQLRALSLAEPFGRVGDRTLWTTKAAPREVAKALRRLIHEDESVTGALLAKPPAENELWIAAEWWGRLVIEPSLLPLLEDEREHWHVVQEVPERNLAVLAPAPVARSDARRVDADAFRAAIASDEPFATEAPLEAVLAEPARWFGDLADPAVGGALVLIALSFPDHEGNRILLRTPAALGLRHVDGPSLAARLRGEGVVAQVHAESSRLGRDALASRWLERDARLSEEAVWSELEQAQGAQFLALFTFAASVDPVIEIEAGSVLEQLTPFDAQHLAVARPRTVTIGVDQVVPIALPAWCLNRSLPPPSGQRLRSTPLALAQGRSQDVVWNQLNERLASTR